MRRIIVLSASLFLLVACSGGGHPSATPTPRSTDDAAGFARCMRDHGVDLPDPGPSFEWGQLHPDQSWETALQACRQYMPNGGNLDSGPDEQELERLRAFAVCMRGHDIEMTDPDASGNMRIDGRLGSLNRTQLEADPGYQAAFDACKDQLPENDPHKKGGK